MTAERSGHTPVLVTSVCELLAVREGQTVVDATVGLGGHAVRFAQRLGADGMLLGLDVDPASLAGARRSLADAPCRVKLVRRNFAELDAVLDELGVERVDVIFADLGVSSRQLNDPERGFSFQQDGPLDMRMNPRGTVTAVDLVNRLKERDLADLIYHNAQEPGARRIARRICAVRREKRITRTRQLVDAVLDALGVDEDARRAKIHPATRTFLALRIAVNEEITSLERLLDMAPRLLRENGRIGVIAFHSLEDKPVKLDFRRRSQHGVYRILTKKPVIADAAERRLNPRARSAKLRVAVRLAADSGA